MDLSNILYLNIEKEYSFPLGTPIQQVNKPEPKSRTDKYYIVTLRPEQFGKFMNGIRQAINCAGVICLELETSQIATLLQLPEIVIYVGMPSKETLVSTLSNPQDAKKHMETERKILNMVIALESMLVPGGVTSNG
jgi:hypothetical protein